MPKATISFLLIVTLLLGSTLSAFAEPYGGLLPDPASPVQSEINRLFLWITIMAVAVGGLVFFLMLWFLHRYRESKHPQTTKKPMAENRPLEWAWTLGPAIILGVMVAITIPVLQMTDEGPREDFTIRVVGRQWVWQFYYPDGNSTTEHLYVEVGRVVKLEVTSEDVIHSFYVAQLGVKIDANPGRTGYSWFQATKTGSFHVQCAEFCGLAHSQMSGDVVVFSKGKYPKPYGAPPTTREPTDNLTSGRVVEVELLESGGSGSTPWSINPGTITAQQNEKLALRVWNNNTNPHNFTLEAPYDLQISLIPANTHAWLNFTAGNATAGTPYYCAFPTHRALGMAGFLIVRSARTIHVELKEWSITPPVISVGLNESVAILVHNNGTTVHNFTIKNPYNLRLPVILQVGDSAWLNFTADRATTSKDICEVGGHEQLGMVGELRVGAAPPPPEKPKPNTVPGFEGVFLLLGLLLAWGIARRSRRG